MALTFLYSIESQGNNVAVKFESPSTVTSQFMVTFLTAPHVEPFIMTLENDRWKLPERIPQEVSVVASELLEAAKKFQR